MKIQKNFKPDYESFGITEENGYVQWYDWKKLRSPVRIIGYVLIFACFVCARIFKEELNAFGKANTVIAAFCALAALLIIVVPLHEILHLLAMSKGKLDDRCIITAGQGAVSAGFNGHITRNGQIFALLLPVTVFSVIFAAAVALTSGLLRLFFIYLLIMSTLSSYTDIYMVFYLLKHLKKTDTIFGIYKKS